MKNNQRPLTEEQRLHRLFLDLEDDFTDLTCLPYFTNPEKARKQLQLSIYGRMMKLTRIANQLLQKGATHA